MHGISSPFTRWTVTTLARLHVIRTGSGRQVMATLRDLVIAILKPGGASNIAVATRRHAHDATGILAILGLTPA